MKDSNPIRQVGCYQGKTPERQGGLRPNEEWSSQGSGAINFSSESFPDLVGATGRGRGSDGEAPGGEHKRRVTILEASGG